MRMDNNQERSAVKNVFRVYKENEQYLSTPQEFNRTQAQLMMSFSDGNIEFVDEHIILRADAQQYNQKVTECVQQLSGLEQKIIIPSFMNKEYVIPWRIYEPLGIGRTLFYTTKDKAIGKLFVLFKMQNLLRKSPDKIYASR